MKRRPVMTVIVVPDETKGESSTYRLSPARVLLFKVAAGVVGVALVGVLASWSYLATRAARVDGLEAALTSREVDQEALMALSTQLDELTSRYQQLRSLFGVDTVGVPSNLWLPPARGRAALDVGEDAGNLPTTWPLAERGFVTRSLLEGSQGEHPGLDIAVPSDTYVRSAAAGTVTEVGEDEIYGRFVIVDHGNGYQSRYAHASQTMVSVAQPVRRSQVIALSGSTGRSTAPHLHFEILLNGDAVDPLSLVRQP